MSDLTPIPLLCRIEDVHPAADKDHKFLKLKLSTNLLLEQFELFYPNHERLKPFFDVGFLAESAKLLGSSRKFFLQITNDNAVQLLETDAILASCDVGIVEANHLPCDFLFIIIIGENRDLLLNLAKYLKEIVPVIFSVPQGELSLQEETSLAEAVMDEVGKQIEADPHLLGPDTTLTYHPGPGRRTVTATDNPKKRRNRK